MKKYTCQKSNKITCHPEAHSRHSEALAEESTCNKNNKIGCHPEERSELRILPIMKDNKERWSDSEHTKSSHNAKADASE